MPILLVALLLLHISSLRHPAEAERAIDRPKRAGQKGFNLLRTTWLQDNRIGLRKLKWKKARGTTVPNPSPLLVDQMFMA